MKILNESCGDLSDLIHTPSKFSRYSYYCTSNRCTKYGHDTAKVMRFEAVKLRFDTDCPECGSSMLCRKVKTVSEEEAND